MTVHKDLLRPGVYTLPNRVKWTCSPGDVRNACVVGNRMLGHADALAPPLIWEHDWNAEAAPVRVLLSAMAGERRREWAAGYASNVFGHPTRFYLKDEGGRPVLWSENRIKPDAGRRFEAARFVSPRIDHDYTAGDGTHWPGATVHHIAATPRPVQLGQLPVMLSGLIGAGRSRKSFLINRVYLGGNPMADEKDKDGDGGADAGVKRLLTSLANFGINLPDGVNSVEDLALAIDTLAANNAGGATGGDEDPLDDLDAAPGDAAPAGAMMSDVAANHRKRLVARLKKIEGHAVKRHIQTAPQLRQLEADLTRVPEPALLSDLAGRQPDRNSAVARLVAVENALREAIRPGSTRAHGQAVQLSDLDPKPAPQLGQAGKATPDQIQAELERVRNEGRGPKPAAK
jgi:hypothetical protein